MTGEAEEKEREHPLLYKAMDPTLIQIEQMIQKVKTASFHSLLSEAMIANVV